MGWHAVPGRSSNTHAAECRRVPGNVSAVSGVRLAVRLVLAAVFAVAGVAKLLDQRGFREAVVGFGVPRRFAATVAWSLPVVELAVAVLLVWPDTSWWGAVGALVLLAVFSVGIAANLGSGRRPECHCFGQLHPEPVSAKMLVRNVVLAVPAAFLVLAG